jgi:hypothetical protein
MTRVVVFAPQGVSLENALPDLGASHHVLLVRWCGDPSDDEAIVCLPRGRRAEQWARRLSATLPGRVLARLLPLDAGVRFWQASKRSQKVADGVRRADLLVAAERDAGFAVWRWHRRTGAAHAVRGLPAARTWIDGLDG